MRLTIWHIPNETGAKLPFEIVRSHVAVFLFSQGVNNDKPIKRYTLMRPSLFADIVIKKGEQPREIAQSQKAVLDPFHLVCAIWSSCLLKITERHFWTLKGSSFGSGGIPSLESLGRARFAVLALLCCAFVVKLPISSPKLKGSPDRKAKRKKS